MKTYEYKIIAIKAQLGLNFEKKCQELEDNWNELGKQGWKFCTWGNDCAVFMRELVKREV